MQSHNSLDSPLRRLAKSARWGAPGQMKTDSDKMYGLDDTDFVHHQTNGNPETVASKGRF